VKRDLKNAIAVRQSLAPAARTATADGTGVDVNGLSSPVIIIDAGTATGTTPSFTFEIQHSDASGSGYTAVDDADLDGSEPVITDANDAAVYRIGYKGIKRYVRVILKTIGGTSTPTLPCTALIVAESGRKAPRS